MSSTVILQGVPYAQLLADIRAMLPAIVAAPTSAPAPELGGIELAREVTGLSKSRIYGLVSERAIPHSKLGNRLFFKRSELMEWIADGKRGE